jgi:cytochrome c oxidase cbb3-type subunit 3
MQAVAGFVRREFVLAKAPNTRYHTVENGWPDHERYAAAFPFVTGALSLDIPPERLDASQAAGRRLFVSACITCHDRGAGPAIWEPRAVSYPPSPATCLSCHNREGIPVRQPGASGRSLSPTYHGREHPADPGDPYSLHDRVPRLAGLDRVEREGERLYQANCAFCHAADGTGRNWIGAFLEPHPTDFTNPAHRARLTASRVAKIAREGVPGSSMPAWKNVLEERDLAAVAAYIERAFLRPAGQITRE